MSPFNVDGARRRNCLSEKTKQTTKMEDVRDTWRCGVCRLIKVGEAKVLQFQLFILNSITKTRRVRGANAVYAENLVVLKNEQE